jgi:putative oxidoreductase
MPSRSIKALVHGVNKAFGPGGLAGTTRWFDSLGLRPAAWHARLAAVTEVLAGALVTVGLFTTAATAAFVGLMTVAIVTDHWGKGYFVFKGGSEYALLIAMVAVAVASVGPGAWSLDAMMGLELAGPLWALGATLVGVASALSLVAACHRPSRSS